MCERESTVQTSGSILSYPNIIIIINLLDCQTEEKGNQHKLRTQQRCVVLCLIFLKISHPNVFLSFSTQIYILHREQPVKHVSHIMAQPKSMQLSHHPTPVFNTQSSGEWHRMWAHISYEDWMRDCASFLSSDLVFHSPGYHIRPKFDKLFIICVSYLFIYFITIPKIYITSFF